MINIHITWITRNSINCLRELKIRDRDTINMLLGGKCIRKCKSFLIPSLYYS